MSHLIYQLLALLILTFQKILRENMETDSGHDTIYNQVGEMIGSVADNVNSFGLPKDDVTSLIEEVLREHPLPFELADLKKKSQKGRRIFFVNFLRGFRPNLRGGNSSFEKGQRAACGTRVLNA